MSGREVMEFTSRDADSVQSTWQQYVPSARLQRIDPRRFRFDWRASDLGTATLVRYDLEAGVQSTAAPEGQLLVCRVTAPGCRVWAGSREIDPAQAWATDGRPVQASWHRGARVRALVFDREAAQERARRLTGADDVVLRVGELDPRSAADAIRWERAFEYIDAQMRCDPPDILRAELERHALIATLAAFRTTFDARMQSPEPQRSAAPVTVRRALAYIEQNAHLPITIEDVAAACFISTRGLQYAFRRALDTTPAAELRRARLAGAHADLRSGRASTVADVARKWGFSHPSRFAVAYRTEYGALPSSSLLR